MIVIDRPEVGVGEVALGDRLQEPCFYPDPASDLSCSGLVTALRADASRRRSAPAKEVSGWLWTGASVRETVAATRTTPPRKGRPRLR
jgi:hypothetical protein